MYTLRFCISRMIGIFDSGFGGLSTLKEWHKIAPEYDILYLGDSARAPYGPRSTQTITEYTKQGVDFLFSKGAKIVLIACNTASADALRVLQIQYPEKKILGAIIPAVEEALQKTRFGRIGLIATRGTVSSKNYEQEIAKRTLIHYAPTEKRALESPVVFSKAAPLLVPLVEENYIKKPETRMILRKYLAPLKNANIDTLILGCTHYPLLQKEFEKKMGARCTVVNSGAAQARSFLDYLSRHTDIEQALTKNGSMYFYTTDSTERFCEIGSQFLGRKIGKNDIEKVELK
jgi:glutamate racemase